jgi:hypothetical protein
MKKIKVLFLVAFSLFFVISCDNQQRDGGPCEYTDISHRVKIIDVEKDSLDILVIKLQVVNTSQTIHLNREDFEIMNLNPIDFITQSDTTTFLLSGKENTVGTCQPFFWQKITTP